MNKTELERKSEKVIPNPYVSSEPWPQYKMSKRNNQKMAKNDKANIQSLMTKLKNFIARVFRKIENKCFTMGEESLFIGRQVANIVNEQQENVIGP